MNKADVGTSTIAPVLKKIRVSLAPAAAFRLFTEEMGSWWPLRTHSIGEEQAESCVFETRLGGRIYEVNQDGSQSEWGEVLAWEPPRRVVFSWYPGREAQTAQEVEVTFTAMAGGTQVVLVHRGWERLGERAQEMRAGYDSGWDYVLGHYMAKTGA